MSKKKKKRLRGEGWSFEPADRGSAEKERTESSPPEEQRIRVRVETRKKGKVVTTASGFALTPGDLRDLARDLKKTAGGGGSCAGDAVEIQGDHAELLRAELEERGYRVC